MRTCDHRRIEDMNATLDARPPAVVFGDNLPQQKSGARERQIPQQDPLGSVPVEGHPTPAIAVSAQYETGAVTGGGLGRTRWSGVKGGGGWDGAGWTGERWDGMWWDGAGWGGMRWDDLGWDEMRWDGSGRRVRWIKRGPTRSGWDRLGSTG